MRPLASPWQEAAIAARGFSLPGILAEVAPEVNADDHEIVILFVKTR
jgi:hypothetical protein